MIYYFDERNAYFQDARYVSKYGDVQKYVQIISTFKNNIRRLIVNVDYASFQYDVQGVAIIKESERIFLSEIEKIEKSPRYINALDVNMREKPTTKSKIIATLREGTEDKGKIIRP